MSNGTEMLVTMIHNISIYVCVCVCERERERERERDVHKKGEYEQNCN